MASLNKERYLQYVFLHAQPQHIHSKSPHHKGVTNYMTYPNSKAKNPEGAQHNTQHHASFGA
ncbi:hypothetical protein E2C01_045433 [Portunus trituberculatus]|uniref:Uncharacterized protein n=1 Tax=Portunus trituberculatus TaxID=210409 RepID=A0A5B7G2V3_PORTR|nr:hypothetical protein [Portunus trituberculatus]